MQPSNQPPNFEYPEFSERDLINSLLNDRPESSFDVLFFGNGNADCSPSQRLPDTQETFEEYVQRTTIPQNLPSDYVPSVEEIYRPLSNATSVFPKFKKEPYDPNIFTLGFENATTSSESKCQQQKSPQSLKREAPLDTCTTSSTAFESPDEDPKADRPSKKQKSAVEKEQARAEQQRLASKRYRQKKKALVEQLEKKMQQLVAEKQRIEAEHQSTMEMVEKLKMENSTLRKVHHKDGDSVEKERLKHLSKLDELMRRGASDEELTAIINSLFDCCRRISQIGEWQGKSLITPNVVTHLVESGFFEVPALEDPTDPIEQFVAKLSETVTSLTPTQKAELTHLAEVHAEKILPIKSEREILNKELTQFFSNANVTFLAKKENDMPRLLQIMSTLEYVRKNLSEEIQSVMNSVQAILNVLKPRQQAQFFLEAEFQHRSVQQLKAMWEAMKNSTLQKQ